jgi:hypothetical protein
MHPPITSAAAQVLRRLRRLLRDHRDKLDALVAQLLEHGTPHPPGVYAGGSIPHNASRLEALRLAPAIFSPARPIRCFAAVPQCVKHAPHQRELLVHALLPLPASALAW